MLSYLVPLVLLLGSSVTGQALLDSSFQKLLKTKSISFELKFPGMDASTPGLQRMSISMMRGGFYRMEMPNMEMIATPKFQILAMVEQKEYVRMPSLGEAATVTPYPGFEALASKDAKPLKAVGEPRLVQIDDRWVYRVPIAETPTWPMRGAMILLDRKTVLPAGLTMDAGGQMVSFLFDNMKVDALAEDHFTWTAPDGWKETSAQDVVASASSGEDDYSAKLLKIGTTAPEFAGKTTKGDTMRLSQYRKSKKATLINFWFYG